MHKIVILDGYTTNPGDLLWETMKSLGQVNIFDRTPSDLIYDRVKDAHIIITNKVPISKELLSKLTELKLIVVMATGYNIVDTVSARSHNIPVCNVRDYSSKSVAQQVFSYILHFQNKVASFNQKVHHGTWSKSPDFTFYLGETHEVYNKIIGIVGFGKIGQEVAKIADAFGMKIWVASRNPKRDAASHIEVVSLEKLLSESDFISLHVPLNESTKHLINENSLKRMKSTAIIINTGRGQLIDEKALSKALKNKQIQGAALDVLSEEPPKENHPLLGIENCIVTPHTAWSSREARSRLLQGVVKNIQAFQKGQTINVVN